MNIRLIRTVARRLEEKVANHEKRKKKLDLDRFRIDI